MIKAIRGMHDVLPTESAAWRYIERTFRQLMDSYGYGEMRMPVVEKAALFVRTVGEATDIVEKEMYNFVDRNDERLCLRPEGTAGCVRAGIENGLLQRSGPQRVWYCGPMFRRERPQKGRYRQFHQFGVETFGMAGPEIDAELLLLTARLWKMLGINGLELQINSLGTVAARARYRQQLVAYFNGYLEQLDSDSQRRLKTNPLRILDSKNPSMQAVIDGAPKLCDCLDDESEKDFSRLCALLDAAGVAYSVNPRLVRGLDYYEKLVFEWVGTIGAQSTVCAGGRYDGLVSQLGGPVTPAAGFALGIERLLALLDEEKLAALKPVSDAYLVLAGEAAREHGLVLAESVRDTLPELRLRVNCGDGSFKSQLKRADRSGASLALILGEDELAEARITVKYLRQERQQQTIPQTALTALLREEICNHVQERG